MHVGLRGPVSMYQPDFTVATVQPISAAKITNGLRMIWFNDNAGKYARQRGGYCDYQDIEWGLDTFQPTVYAGCNRVNTSQGLRFLIMTRINGSSIISVIGVGSSADE